jgi:hypothetical protein
MRALKPTLFLLFGLFVSYAALAQTPTPPIPAEDPHHCGAGNHWDPTMGSGMCMPGVATPTPPPVTEDPHHCGAGNHWDPTMGSGMCMPGAATPTPPPVTEDPHHCGAGNHWDPTMGGGMCMPGAPAPSERGTQIAFHLNQFLVAGDTTGPRGRFAGYAPDMWMLNVNQTLSAHHTLQVSFMGTADRWTVPSNGSPETFQTGEANNQGVPYLDAQHPHSSPIMGLTFSDILTLNSAGDHTLTFFFAPRGEATAGPESFMHRQSSVGNPYAPLSHHLQDLFHISSTVLGARYTDGVNTFEASTFSGQEPRPESVNLDMHRPDSYAARYTRQIDPVVRIGASYARVFVNPAAPEAGEPAQSHADYVSANAATESTVGRGTLNTDTIWGMAYNETTQTSLNSFLTEFVYQLGKNNFFGRMEVVQRSSDQLEIKLSNPDGEIHWVKAVTLGYERQISSRNGINLFMGGSVTQNLTPEAFRPAYGAAPMGLEIHLRLNLMRSRTRHH